MKVKDMGISRNDAINRCVPLGKRFIQHFDKIYHNPKNEAVNHWCNEMQNWLNIVSSIKMKPYGKPIFNGDLRDWFFTAGASPEDFMNNSDYDEEKAYDDFVTYLINTKDVKESIDKMLKTMLNDSEKTLDDIWQETYERICPLELHYDDLDIEIEEDCSEDYWNYNIDEPDTDDCTEKRVVNEYDYDLWEVDDGTFKEWVSEYLEKDEKDITKEDLEDIDESMFYDYLLDKFYDNVVEEIENQ